MSQFARDFAATGLSYAQIKGISDSELMELLAGGRTADARYAALGAWFERCARELKRVGVTIQQIWGGDRQDLDKNLVLRLSDGNWVQEHRNVIVTGPTGVGKSFLCSAIGHQACLHGFKTRYFNCTKFFPQTRLWVADGSYLKQIDQIARTDVVIFDDFGLQHLDGPARLTLLEVLEDRVGRRSTVFASQLPVASWFQVIGDATIADAICDRLIHHSVRIDLQGESLRKPQAAQELPTGPRPAWSWEKLG